MRRCLTILVVATAVGLACGCGSVYLRGDALTAAETSAMDAYGAAQRAGARTAGVPPALPEAGETPAAPPWLKGYLVENFKQWRSFVRSARKDLSWGPKLEGE